MSPKLKPERILAKVWCTDLSGRLLDLLAEKRKAHGRANGSKTTWSIRKLAVRSGIDHSSIVRFMDRKRVMDIQHMDRLLAGMDMSILDLLTVHELSAALDHLPAQHRYSAKRQYRETISSQIAAAVAKPVDIPLDTPPHGVDSTPNKVLDSGGESN